MIPRTLLVSGMACLACCVASAADVSVNGLRATVPEGFTLELVAGNDLVSRPVSACFDDRGRLYVTESSGSNEPPEQQLKAPTHRIRRLEDTNGDGVFDRSIVFAEGVMFPQGCLWHAGSVYVAGPPNIWKFTDTDGDGVSDRREEWFKGGTLTGCANDIHGPHLGPDGFLYWTKGAFSEQTHRLANGSTLKDRAAHIYRARPDGSGLDVIMHGGMDNPVEIAFTPEGETIFSSTFIDFTQPGFRDGVAHAIYGGVYGKENDVLTDGRVPRTSPDVFHPFFQAGPAAECGLTRYEGRAWGPEFQDNLFSTSFNLHRVSRHALRPNGATYASDSKDFLMVDSVDFHPTDVLQDPDGHLLVVDTGGWYKLCCPSSQLAKPDVLGGIYRIRKSGVPTLSGSARQEAQRRLAQPPGLDGSWEAARLKQAVWTLDAGQAKTFREVLQARGQGPEAAPDAAALRVAAEGLGRLKDRTAVPLLLKAAGHSTDPFLVHAYLYALIGIGAPVETRSGLTLESPGARRAALIALDQMPEGGLRAGDVVPHLGASDESLRRAAEWILGRHPEWGSDLAGWFRGVLKASGDSTERRAALAQLRILGRDEIGQKLLADLLAPSAFPSDAQQAALRVMAESGLKEPPSAWSPAVVAVLSGISDPKDPRLPEALRAARALRSAGSIQEALRRVGRDPRLPLALRMDALAALPENSRLEAADYDLARGALSPEVDPTTRVAAAGALSRAALTGDQLKGLLQPVKTAGPLELTRLLSAFREGGDDTLGLPLVAALQDSRSAKALAPGQVRPFFAKFPEATQKQLGILLSGLDADATQQAARLEALLKELQGVDADVRRGQAVFNGSKAACSSCHRIGYLGGNVGPELTRIGEVRSERDLLESVIYPSASFVRSYEPTTLVLEGGDEVHGIVRQETDSEWVIATGPGAEQRLAKATVKEVRPGTVSLMPGGFDQVLSRQELADLLHFVKTVRWR
ncbi:MAG: hypothetical protein RLZ45_1698 [Verrucomicrobiota bacterium]|jgi:putative membrane-bound dehydrogenase-like protein